MLLELNYSKFNAKLKLSQYVQSNFTHNFLKKFLVAVKERYVINEFNNYFLIRNTKIGKLIEENI